MKIPFLLCAVAGLGVTIANAGNDVVPSGTPMKRIVEYQYQLNYPRFGWGFGHGGYGGYGGYGYGGYGYGGYGGNGGYGYGGYPGYGGYGFGAGWNGPGLSLGGTLPANSREGISSFYGLPMPVPLGAGVYMNPFTYSSRLPGPNSYGLDTQLSLPSINAPAGRTAPVNPAVINPSNLPAPAPPAESTNTRRSNQQVFKSAPSTPEYRLKSKELVLAGDSFFKRQMWNQAQVHYRNASIIAADLSEPHVRLGMVSMQMKRYSDAAGQFKQALIRDGSVADTETAMDSLLGTDNQNSRTEVINDVASWTKENVRDQDRLFLLAYLLRCQQDSRSDQILEAAMNLPGNQDHLVALISTSTLPLDVATKANDLHSTDSAIGDLKPARATNALPVLSDQPLVSAPIAASSPQNLPELHQQPVALH